MTDEQINDCYTSLGRAFAERRELQKRAGELKVELNRVADAIKTLTDNPLYEAGLKIMAEVDDPREHLQEYLTAVRRLAQLDKILAD